MVKIKTNLFKGKTMDIILKISSFLSSVISINAGYQATTLEMVSKDVRNKFLLSLVVVGFILIFA